jgi:hypothetical protein
MTQKGNLYGISFSPGAVLSNQLAHKTGNTSEQMYLNSEQIMKQTKQQSKIKSLGDEIEDTNAYNWNSLGLNGRQIHQGFATQLPAYINQARMSTYYQDNPWPTLSYSQKYGIEEPLGGFIRGDIPPGHYPGNVLKNNPGPTSSREGNNFGSTLFAPGQKVEHFTNVDIFDDDSSQIGNTDKVVKMLSVGIVCLAALGFYTVCK